MGKGFKPKGVCPYYAHTHNTVLTLGSYILTVIALYLINNISRDFLKLLGVNGNSLIRKFV